MAKTISFTYKDKEYTLEFTRKTIEAMERGGFDISGIDSKPLQTLHHLFIGSFKCHHSSVGNTTIDEIYDKMKNAGGLMKSLVEMYKETIESLTDVESSVGEIEWEMK